MAELVAQGKQPQQRWRQPLPAGQLLVLGRGAVALSVPWDEQISREHVELCWQADKLEMRRRASARNPVFFQGQQVEQASLAVGQHFVIGQTTFTLAEEVAQVSLNLPQPVEERTFTAAYLKE